MENITKRGLAALVIGGIIIVSVTIWGTVTVIDKLVRDPSDPLAKAGGLKASGSFFHTLSPEERQTWQDTVDNAYDLTLRPRKSGIVPSKAPFL